MFLPLELVLDPGQKPLKLVHSEASCGRKIENNAIREEK